MRAIIPEMVREEYGGSTRSFRAAKREEADKVLAALDDLRFASAFLPREAYDKLYDAHKKLLEMRDLLRADTWGR